MIFIHGYAHHRMSLNKQTTHKEAIQRLCRVCGYFLKRGGRVSYLVKKSESLLSDAFSFDTSKDDPNVHPPSYCHKCRNVMQRTLKKGPTYTHTVTPFDWTEHIDKNDDSMVECKVCLHIVNLEKGGRKDKKEKEKTGRPSKGSIKSIYIRTVSIAPPTIKRNRKQLAQGVTVEDITCPICLDILDRPIELVPCQAVICHKCLVSWVEISETSQCPCCYSDHLQDTDTITGVTPLLLTLLSVVPVRCRECDCLVPAPEYDSHRCNDCVIQPCSPNEEKRLTVQSILKRDIDVPLSTLEEDLLGSLVKRSLSHKQSANLEIKTGGQVSISPSSIQNAVTNYYICIYLATYIHGCYKAPCGYR